MQSQLFQTKSRRGLSVNERHTPSFRLFGLGRQLGSSHLDAAIGDGGTGALAADVGSDEGALRQAGIAPCGVEQLRGLERGGAGDLDGLVACGKALWPGQVLAVIGPSGVERRAWACRWGWMVMGSPGDAPATARA